MLPRSLLIAIFELTIIAGQLWHPYETYDRDFYNPYQGMGYSTRGCAGIIITGVPCQQQQPVRLWNLYPDYQSQFYNTRPHVPDVMSQIYAQYGGATGVIPQNPGFPMDLSHGVFPNSAGVPLLAGNALSTRLLGANILNDKDKFEARGCSFDTGRGRCNDNLNICKGKCKDFGNGLTHDCRCIPEDLLTILGLTVLRE